MRPHICQLACSLTHLSAPDARAEFKSYPQQGHAAHKRCLAAHVVDLKDECIMEVINHALHPDLPKMANLCSPAQDAGQREHEGDGGTGQGHDAHGSALLAAVDRHQGPDEGQTVGRVLVAVHHERACKASKAQPRAMPVFGLGLVVSCDLWTGAQASATSAQMRVRP